MNPIRQHFRRAPAPTPTALPKVTPPPPLVTQDDRPPAIPSVSLWERAVLGGLQRKHIYAGTVPPAVIARRRRRAKQARLSRRANRR